MTTRIREQLERVPDLTTKSALTITAVPVDLSSGRADATLEQQVQTLAGCLTQMILSNRERKQVCTGKVTRLSN
jgi:hypothetical protein